MTRRPGRGRLPAAAVLALAAAGACGARGGPIRVARVLARGVLAYDVAAPADGAFAVSVELATDFELVARALPPAGAGGPGPVRWRAPLGPATWDVVDVDVDGAGVHAAVASLDGTVRLHDARTGAERARLRLDAAATAVAFSPDGAYLATGAASGVLCLRRVADLALLQCVAAHEGRIAALAACAAPGGDGPILGSAGWDGAAVLWHLPSLAIRARHARRGAATAVAFAPGCGHLAVARAGAPPARPPARPDPAAAVELLDVGRPPPRSGGPAPAPRILRGHAAAVVAAAFTGDGDRLVTASWDRTVRLWDARTGAPLGRLAGFSHGVRGLAPATGGRIVVASWAGADRDGRAVTLVELP